jgi:hypothetical protein
MKTMPHSLYVGCLVTCSDDLDKIGWQHLWTAFLVVHLEYRVHDFQGESPRSGLNWLYLAMALLKALFCELGLSPG